MRGEEEKKEKGERKRTRIEEENAVCYLNREERDRNELHRTNFIAH